MKTRQKTTKSVRVDGQMTGLAGELFVAAELLKRGLQTSVTFGNAKSIDLLAFNPQIEESFTVQVKAIRKKNVFPIGHKSVNPLHVFVILNGSEEPVQYFVVPGSVLAQQPERFVLRWFTDTKFPGINWRILQKEGFENAWHVFQERKSANKALHGDAPAARVSAAAENKNG